MPAVISAVSPSEKYVSATIRARPSRPASFQAGSVVAPRRMGYSGQAGITVRDPTVADWKGVAERVRSQQWPLKEGLAAR